jgi:cytochrome c
MIGAAALAQAQPAVDEDAAEKQLKRSGCNKCQSLSAKKEGPPYKETAAKYKGKPDAEDKLYKHLTTNPTIEVDGKKERHDSPKSKKEDDVRNIVRYILTR